MIAAIYARKSTEQNGVAEEQKSVARQVEHARGYAAAKGWTVCEEHVFVDDGISGAEFANRPGFIRLMNALKPRARFQVLVMSEVSRLGREQIETAYALKQLSVAGVRCFSYFEDRELLMESATDKFLLGAVTFAADLEREKARQRVYDAMHRKARAGHVTGGTLFGYRNIDVTTPDGRRSHVAREIDAGQAEVICRIFQLCADGHGLKTIAKILNDERAPSPRAQRGRSQSWAPSSVREVLFRPVYRGEIVWNQSRKRDRWGQHRQVGRPEGEWIRVPAPHLRIVGDDAWQKAHARLSAARSIYLGSTQGERFGRPALGNPSPYLLTNLATCGRCGGTLRVRTRKQGSHGRAHLYGCSNYHERGRSVCTNRSDVPMVDADLAVLEALLEDVLTADLLEAAVDQALALLQGDGSAERRARVDAELVHVEHERRRFVAAIAAGGELDALVVALKERETRLLSLKVERLVLAPQRRLSGGEGLRVRAELMTLADRWRQVLVEDPAHARPLVSSLLAGRVRFVPLEPGPGWEMTGSGTLAGLFTRELSIYIPVGVASPGASAPQVFSTATERQGRGTARLVTVMLPLAA